LIERLHSDWSVVNAGRHLLVRPANGGAVKKVETMRAYGTRAARAQEGAAGPEGKREAKSLKWSRALASTWVPLSCSRPRVRSAFGGEWGEHDERAV
jgi:hypothetical protein